MNQERGLLGKFVAAVIANPGVHGCGSDCSRCCVSGLVPN